MMNKPIKKIYKAFQYLVLKLTQINSTNDTFYVCENPFIFFNEQRCSNIFLMGNIIANWTILWLKIKQLEIKLIGLIRKSWKNEFIQLKLTCIVPPIPLQGYEIIGFTGQYNSGTIVVNFVVELTHRRNQYFLQQAIWPTFCLTIW